MKRRAKNPNKILRVLILALCAILIALVTVAIVKTTTAKKDDGGIVYAGRTLKDGDNLGYLNQNATFEGADEYAVTIKARYVEANDFSFTYLSEPYTWKDMDGKRVTNGFIITRISDEVIISYPSLIDLLNTCLGGDSVKVTNALKADFSMILKSDDEEITVYFTLFVGELYLDETSIIF
jgi:hypothetical protein